MRARARRLTGSRYCNARTLQAATRLTYGLRPPGKSPHVRQVIPAPVLDKKSVGQSLRDHDGTTWHIYATKAHCYHPHPPPPQRGADLGPGRATETTTRARRAAVNRPYHLPRPRTCRDGSAGVCRVQCSWRFRRLHQPVQDLEVADAEPVPLAKLALQGRARRRVQGGHLAPGGHHGVRRQGIGCHAHGRWRALPGSLSTGRTPAKFRASQPLDRDL